MNEIFTDMDHKKPLGAKSVALSNASLFSQMRPGQFFKMAESPFKINMMDCFEKMQMNQFGGGS